MSNKLASKGSGKWIVGLTGVFGAGKSTAAKYFEELGAWVIDADKLGHEALEKKSSVYELIRAIFTDCLETDGSLSRKKLAAVVFASPEKRKDLEAIIHPFVLQRIREQVQAASKGIIILEVPLLFEAGFDLFCDQTITVESALPEIEARLKKKGFTAHQIKHRWNAQTSQEEKIKKANFVLRNKENLLQTKQEVERVWKQLQIASKGEK